MLKSLSIDNFALIDKSLINFNPGFTVITGETGSGKSILLNALNLILGERADFGVIGPRKDKAIVEATLNLKGFGLSAFFELNDLDYSDESVIRREISKEGRSRAFINDTPVQLNILRELGSRLIHIHSQYNTLELKDQRFQLEILDVLAGTSAKRDQFTVLYKQIQDLRSKRDAIQVDLAKARQEEDYNTFQLNELSSLNLDSTNYKELDERFKIYESADELRTILGALSALGHADSGFLVQLRELKSKFSKKRGLSDAIDQLIDRVDNLLIEMSDINLEAEKELNKLETDPAEMSRISGLLDEYNRLLFKYKLHDQDDLVNYKNELQQSIDTVKASDDSLNMLNKEILEKEVKLKNLGMELHQLRLAASKRIEDDLKTELDALKLPDAKLSFVLSERNEPDSTGYSVVSIEFSPNKGMATVPIQKAASGGELSRVMLSLQYLISQRTQLQTVLFDEIDTGVSGDVAGRIGQTLRRMGDVMQVIAITHLPQVAGKGQHHLRVYKLTGVDERTKTVVQTLSNEDRVDEIARLMSGDTITEGARSNAKSLLRS